MRKVGEVPWAVGDYCVSLKVLKSPNKEIHSFKLTMLWLALSSSLSSAKYLHQCSMHKKTLKPTRTVANPRHLDSTKMLMIDQQYADDVSWITDHDETVLQLRKEVPSILKEKNLQTNVGKTEQHEIERNGSDSWKKCKYLGSLLDTEQDISRRKILATPAYNQLKQIFESKKVQISIKMRLLKSHVESIFLYNSELWTLTKKLENTINVFQRNLLRKILNIKWPNKISNKAPYKRMEIDEWSKTIKERRLSWYGHILRLPDNTPAKLH